MGDEIFSIVSTTDGGYIFAGKTSSVDGDVTFNNGFNDYWVVKVTGAGAIQWQKTYGGDNDDKAFSIVQTTDGGYVVAGYTNSENGDVLFSRGLEDFWILKLSPTGDIQWQKSLGGGANDYASQVRQTADGGYIIVGTTESSNGDVTGHHPFITIPYRADVWIVKLSAVGGLEWQKALGGSGDDFGYAIRQTFDGGYIVAASSNSPDGDVGVHHGDDRFQDYWIVKLSDTGAIEWQKDLGGNWDDMAYDVVQSTDSGYIVAGMSKSIDGDVIARPGANTHGDYWVLKLSRLGDIQWQRTLGGSDEDVARSVVQTSDGGYLVAGYAESSDGDVSGHRATPVGMLWQYDYWLVKLTPVGDLEWQLCLGGSDFDEANAVLQTADGGYMVAGFTLSTDGDIKGLYGADDCWLVKLGPATSVNEFSLPVALSVSPNPTTGSIYINGVDKATIKVYNTLGSLVAKATSTDNISIATAPPGIYFIRVLNLAGELLYQGSIVKE